MKKIIEILKKKWLRDTSKTIILVVILFAVFIGINVLIQKADIQDIDLTKNKLYTLSDVSINQIKDIQKDVKIYVIGIEEDSSIGDLVKQYTSKNEKITYEIIPDIQDRVDLKSKYNLEDETQLIIVESEENNKILTASDLYTYDYTTYQQIDISEEKITNAIVDLTIDEKPKIYFLTGHNEYSIQNHMIYLNAYLQNEANDVQTLDLLVKDQVPEDTSLLVIASPQKDILDKEVEQITNYINKGGKILFLNDPNFEGTEFPNMQKILDLFGARFDEGIILEQDTDKMALQSPNYIIPNIASTEATKDIVTDGGILLINATRISLAEAEKLEELQVTSQDILTTSEKALFRKEVENTSTTKIASDEEGSFTVGTKLTKKINDETNSTMYLISDNFFLVDYPITIGNAQIYPIQFYNNRDYILNTIAELTDREDTISIRKDTGVITYTATETQDRIIRIIIVAYPTIIILIGIIVWIIRRRKK